MSGHGTNSTYSYHGCRCVDCTRAHADTQTRGNRSRAARLPTANVEHGNPSTYANWGCRCQPCTEANRDRLRRQRSNRRNGWRVTTEGTS